MKQRFIGAAELPGTGIQQLDATITKDELPTLAALGVKSIGPHGEDVRVEFDKEIPPGVVAGIIGRYDRGFRPVSTDKPVLVAEQGGGALVIHTVDFSAAVRTGFED